MESLGDYVVPITVAFAMIGLFFVLGMTYIERRKRSGGSRADAIEMECTACHKMLVIHQNDLTRLSPQETGLIVAAHRLDSGPRLSEYRCPYCKASHTFNIDARPPLWICADSFEPGHAGNHCVNCHKELAKPHWPPNTFEVNVATAPQLQDNHGLVCSRCGAVNCAACVIDVTRNRTTDGTLKCPRCFRSPVNKVHHF